MCVPEAPEDCCGDVELMQCVILALLMVLRKYTQVCECMRIYYRAGGLKIACKLENDKSTELRAGPKSEKNCNHIIMHAHTQ